MEFEERIAQLEQKMLELLKINMEMEIRIKELERKLSNVDNPEDIEIRCDSYNSYS